jgi:hypothetical protein
VASDKISVDPKRIAIATRRGDRAATGSSIHFLLKTLVRQHPYSQKTDKAVAYYYGGTEAQALKDSMTLIRQSAAEMRGGEHVLCINTLTSAREIECAADSISTRSAGKVITYTLTSSTLTHRLEFLKLLVAQKQVRVVVINSIDFAARTSSQCKSLVHWIREMRDVHDCRVVTYGIHEPHELGAMGQLKWISETCEGVGEWRNKEKFDPLTMGGEFVTFEEERPQDVMRAFVNELGREEPIVSDVYVDLPAYSRTTIDEFLATTSLKINDLGGAHRAKREMKNGKLRIKNGEELELQPEEELELA